MVRVVAGFACQAIAIYVMLAVLGWWLRDCLCRTVSEFVDIPVALFGLVLMQVVAWYWTTVFNWGLNGLWPWLIGASLLAGIACVAQRRHCKRPNLIAIWRGTRVQALTAAGSLALFAVNADELFARGTLSISSMNNDVAQYATVAKHLDIAGTSTHGWIQGVDLGKFARDDVHGAVSFVSFGHWVVGGPYFKTMLAILAVGCVLLSQSGAYLISRRTSLGPSATIALALVPQSCFLVIYVARQYFISQVLGMALAVVLVAVVSAPRTRSPLREWRSVVVSGLMVAGLLLTYPHMAILTSPILVAVVVLHNGRQFRASARQVAVLVAAFVGACALIPTRVVTSIQRLESLSSATAGYALEGFTPSELAGFQTTLVRTVSFASISLSVVLLAASLMASIRLRRSGATGWDLPAVGLWACGLGSYGAFYFLRGGPNYQQWKYVTFFEPLIVIGIFAPLVQLAANAWKTSRGAVAALVVGLLVVLNMNSEKATHAINTSNNWVSPDLGNLASNPAFKDIDAVNVQLYPYWETMWAAEALGPRTVYATSQTYWASSTPVADWTLVRNPDVPADQSRAGMISIGSSFDLVRRPTGATSVQLPLASALQVAPDVLTIAAGSSFTGRLTATNSGESTWLSSGPTSGAVNVGIREVDSGGVVIGELGRVPLRSFPFTTAPGATLSVPFSLPALTPGVHRLQFETVSEDVGWFDSDASPAPIVTVTVV